MDSEVVDLEVPTQRSDFENKGETIHECQVQGVPIVILSCESNDCASDNLLESSSVCVCMCVYVHVCACVCVCGCVCACVLVA